MEKIGKSDYCEAIFGSRDLIFFVEAHIEIYFVNMRHIAHHLHINHPTQRGKRKIQANQIIVKPFLGVETLFFLVGAHIKIYFVNIDLQPPTSTLTTPHKGKKRKIQANQIIVKPFLGVKPDFFWQELILEYIL